jgi:hypothetical protein
MKDLRFTGFAYSATQGTNFHVDITFRTDLINAGSNGNFTVLHKSTKSKNASLIKCHEDLFGASFKRLPYNLQAFKDFATAKGLDLRMTDSTGANLVLLVDSQTSSSHS